MSSESDYDDEIEQTVGLINSNMEARAEHLKTRNYRSLYSIATALGVGLLIMLLTWIVRYRGGFAWSSDPTLQFNWHPFLMGVGLIFIYGQSILIYRTARNSLKKNLKLSHAILNGSAFVFAVIALKAVFDSHNNNKPPMANLYSMHSWIGLTAVIVFAGQFVIGFVSFLFPGISRTLRAAILPLHTAIGVATFIFVLTAAISGFTEKTLWTLGNDYSKLPSEAILINFMALFTVLFGVLVLYLVNEGDFKRGNLPEDDELALAQSE